MLSRIIRFIKIDIWRIRLKDLSRSKSFLIKQLRIALLALRGYDEDKCLLRASALTFYSLLSIVPVVAMAFGVAKGFGLEKVLQKTILEKFPNQEEIFIQIFNFANTLLENTKGGIIAGVGVAILFWTIVKVLGNIERSFNDIWGIKTPRKFGRKLIDYLFVMLISPILLVVSSSVTVFVATQVKFITEKIALLGALSPLIFLLLKLLPYGIIWSLFTFIYIFMPNTKVNFKSAMLAGIVAGSIYEFVQWLYLAFQVGVAKYNAIYGSFAALPLFLTWLQLSWLIVLVGAEIAFAHQNVDIYEFEHDSLNVSHSFKKLLALRISQVLIRNFSEGLKPLTATEISHQLEIPIRLARQILYELSEVNLINEVKTQDFKESAYQPARDTESITIKFVIDALDSRGVDNIPVAQNKELKVISDYLDNFAEIVRKSPANRRLRDL